MTLNGVIALVFRFFTEFDCFSGQFPTLWSTSSLFLMSWSALSLFRWHRDRRYRCFWRCHRYRYCRWYCDRCCSCCRSRYCRQSSYSNVTAVFHTFPGQNYVFFSTHFKASRLKSRPIWHYIYISLIISIISIMLLFQTHFMWIK